MIAHGLNYFFQEPVNMPERHIRESYVEVEDGFQV